jgi:hypothetical protein
VPGQKEAEYQKAETCCQTPTRPTSYRAKTVRLSGEKLILSQIKDKNVSFFNSLRVWPN